MAFEQLTIEATNKGLKEKQFSCAELTDEYLRRVEKLNPDINAFIAVTRDRAQEAAKAIDKKGDFSNPLTGTIAGIKDNFCTDGVPTTAGSKILEHYVPPFSATVVEKLFAANPVLLGKLNMDEFACGGSSETSYFGPVKNPWDLSRVPGGSSGGSAAGLAADLCTFTLGTDTGGSIRQPAALTGMVGLKPTYGRVSRYGIVAMASSLDQAGPITKTVKDAAIVLEQIAGVDPLDATTVDVPVDAYSQLLEKSIKGLRIGVPEEYFVAGIEAGVEEAVKAGIKQLESLGAEIVPVSLPHTKYALATYYIIMPSELSTNLARYDGVRYGSSAGKNRLLDNYLETRAGGFGPEIRRRIMVGTHALSSGYYDAYYRQAQKVRTLVRRDFDRAFEHVDCIVTPTAPSVAFKIGEKIDDPLSMYLSDIFTVSVNIAGLPGISIPCGLAQSKDGGNQLPVGLQLIGRPFDEKTILQIAHQFEQSTDWHTKHPAL